MLDTVGLVDMALRGELGADPESISVTGSWSTVQRSAHVGRAEVYRNTVLSLRAGCVVGSCSVEADELPQTEVDDCAGRTLAELLGHERVAIRIAALVAYLGLAVPHERQPGVDTVVIPGGTTLEKSVYRARRVVGLLNPQPGMRVALVGVVNSLILALRGLGADCLPCDFNIGQTEWGDPVSQSWAEVIENADAVLATGMTVSNGSFDPLLVRARDRDIPGAVYAQTGSAIVPRFLGQGVTGVAAEPFPFFSLHSGPTTIYLYRSCLA